LKKEGEIAEPHPGAFEKPVPYVEILERQKQAGHGQITENEHHQHPRQSQGEKLKIAFFLYFLIFAENGHPHFSLNGIA
jgi:hypothetical protein